MKRNSFTPLQINQSIQKKNSTVWESKGASVPFVGTFATLLSQTVHSPRSKKYSKRKFVTGFTLVELLMVTVIIAILATMLYPQFQTFRIRAGLKEVPNTIQLILAGEKYYRFKIGGYFPWTWADADNFVYTVVNPSPPPATLSIEDDILNITFPKDVCEYRVDDSTGKIYFRRANDNTNLGECNIQTGVYDIYTSDYEKYLGYLE